MVMGSALALAEGENAATVRKGEHQKGMREMPPLMDMTVVGKIAKEERQGKEGKTFSFYTLVDAQGNKIALSTGPRRPRKGEDANVPQPAPVNLEEYVGKDVTVIGKGFTFEKGDKKSTRIVEILKVEASAPAPAAAEPAAPATPPAPVQ